MYEYRVKKKHAIFNVLKTSGLNGQTVSGCTVNYCFTSCSLLVVFSLFKKKKRKSSEMYV